MSNDGNVEVEVQDSHDAEPITTKDLVTALNACSQVPSGEVHDGDDGFMSV